VAVENFDFTVDIDAFWQANILHGALIMANRFLRWDKSTSSDVVTYRVRVKKDSPPEDTDPVLEVGNVDFLDLLTVPSLRDADGTYHFSVKAVDEVGLEAEHARVSGPLDFVAPAPATNVRLSEA
jgi:hypothetical protein